jgi:hypothetical protein
VFAFFFAKARDSGDGVGKWGCELHVVVIHFRNSDTAASFILLPPPPTHTHTLQNTHRRLLKRRAWESVLPTCLLPGRASLR